MKYLNDNSGYPILTRCLKGHLDEVTDLSFHPNGKKIASSGADKDLLWWTLGDTVKCYRAKGHLDKITCTTYSSDGQFIATASVDETVRIWIPTLLGKCTSFKGHSSAVRCLSISPCNKEIITCSNDKTIKIWNLRREFLSSLIGHTNWVRCVKYTSCGKLAVSTGDDRSLRVWNIRNNSLIHNFQFFEVSGVYLSIHANDVSVAVAMDNGDIRIYDLRSHKQQQKYVNIHTKTNWVDWHPNGLHLLSCGSEGTSKIINVMEGRPSFTIKGHEGAVNVAKFSPDGDYFATGGTDRMLMIWQSSLEN